MVPNQLLHFYDSKVLEQNKHYMDNILDVIFGKRQTYLGEYLRILS